MNPQSSFTGIPPELRLNIHDHLLASFDQHKFHFVVTHKLIIKSKSAQTVNDCRASLDRAKVLKYKCGIRKLATTMLQINRLVFDELVPILCNKIELWLDTSSDHAGATKCQIQSVLRHMPACTHEHIRKLRLLGERATPLCNFPVRFWDHNYWATTLEELPNLHSLRVHADLSEPPYYRAISAYDLRLRVCAIQGIASQTPSLRFLTLELDREEEKYPREMSLRAWDRVKNDGTSQLTAKLLNDGVDLNVKWYGED